MMKVAPVVTIDGASGVGKGTISRSLAAALGWHYLDSGALYRVLAMAAKQHQIAFDNAQALAVLARHLDVRFEQIDEALPARIILEGADVTTEIRTEAIGHAASQVAALPAVREALLERQRVFRQAPGLVADGRDMGSVIFPTAEVKVFLTASVEVRAERRYQQLQASGQADMSFEDVLQAIRERDDRDRTRTISPLLPAPDATIIDTSALTAEQVFASVMQIVEAKLPQCVAA